MKDLILSFQPESGDGRSIVQHIPDPGLSGLPSLTSPQKKQKRNSFAEQSSEKKQKKSSKQQWTEDNSIISSGDKDEEHDGKEKQTQHPDLAQLICNWESASLGTMS